MGISKAIKRRVEDPIGHLKKYKKNPLKEIKRDFKDVTSTTIGKVVVAAVLIYFGGVLFTGSMTWGAGAATGSAASNLAAGAAAGETVATTGGVVGAGTGVGTGAGAGVGAGVGSSASGAGVGGATAYGTGAATNAGYGSVAAETLAAEGAAATASGVTGAGAGAATEVAAPSILGSVNSGLATGANAVAGFVEANPMASAMMLNAAAGATGDDEMDLAEEKERQQIAYEKRRMNTMKKAYTPENETIGSILRGRMRPTVRVDRG